MTTVMVAGALANKCHNGGEAWVRLSWVLGLRRLGCRVLFVEQIAEGSCVDAAGAPAPFERSANLAYFLAVVERFGLAGSATLIHADGEASAGLGLRELLLAAADTELLVNISGHLTFEPVLNRVRRTAYVDIDPGFTQFWHAAGVPGGRIAPHDFYFTIGENVGKPGCPIPTGGIPWRATRQPVVLEEWPARSTGLDRFTTVASWRCPFGPVEFDGRTYGLKVHEFRKIMPLPVRAAAGFEVALNIHPSDGADLLALHENGWRVVEPRPATADPDAFRAYVQGSGAEFSVAQGVYVDTASGWFSDRTARYLASGKPALVQDTGFRHHLPVGEGLVAFRDLDEAVAGAERIGRDYVDHARAARRIAEEHFDSDRILGRLLEETGVAS